MNSGSCRGSGRRGLTAPTSAPVAISISVSAGRQRLLDAREMCASARLQAAVVTAIEKPIKPIGKHRRVTV